MRRFRLRIVSHGRWARRIAVCFFAAATAAAPLLAADKAEKNAAKEAKAQLGFGVDMARRGLWREALFRFEQVKKLQPNDPKALNNLAVAYEAVGRFEDAELLYREAERLAPSNRDIKKNTSRFREFLNQFRAKKTPAEPPAAPAESKP